MHRAVVVVLACALVVVLGAPALAHVAFMPAELESGRTLEADLVLAHGCGPDGEMPANDDEMAPITAVTLEIPAGVSVVPRDVAGWSASEEGGHLRWDSLDPNGTRAGLRLPVEVAVTAGGSATELWLPVVQECADGTSMSWREAGDMTMATYPAPSLAITEPERQGLPGWLIAVLAAVIGGAAAGAVFVRSGRER